MPIRGPAAAHAKQPQLRRCSRRTQDKFDSSYFTSCQVKSDSPLADVQQATVDVEGKATCRTTSAPPCGPACSPKSSSPPRRRQWQVHTEKPALGKGQH